MSKLLFTMRKLLLSLGLLSLCWVSLPAQEGRLARSADAALPDSALTARLDSLVAARLPQGSEAGIAVYDLTANRPLYACGADRLSRPASTMKLVTAIAALSEPRFDEPFRTEVWCRGQVAADTLHGDLYVVGGFDPELDDEDLDSLVAATARRASFSVVTGRILGDVSMKDSLYWGSGWLWDDNPASFQPYLSPLMLNKGVVQVSVAPGLAGDTATVTVLPASTYYTIYNTARTRTSSAGPLRVTRPWMENSNEILVSGNVTARQTRTINLYSSQDFFMHTFAERLQTAGIRSLRAVPDSLYGFSPLQRDSLCTLLAVHETSAQRVLDEMLKESDNLNAEAVFCRLGLHHTGHRPVRAKDAVKAVRALMEAMGHNPARYRVADGCGLSHYDYLSPELLVSFLRYAYAHTEVFSKLYKALPVGGIDGTLKHRMGRGTPSYKHVYAKTGSYTGINCLAGYLQARNGHWVAFAIMNQNVLSGRRARALQDALCDELILHCP